MKLVKIIIIAAVLALAAWFIIPAFHKTAKEAENSAVQTTRTAVDITKKAEAVTEQANKAIQQTEQIANGADRQ